MKLKNVAEINEKTKAHEMFKRGATRQEMLNSFNVNTYTIDKWRKDFYYSESKMGTIDANLNYIRDLEKELFVLLDGESKGKTNERYQKRSQSLQTIYVSFNALNYKP